MSTSAKEITDTLLSMADEQRARGMLRFFKTGKGEYAEGDIFLGVRNPQVRLVVKAAWRDVPLDEAAALVKSPLHEVRLCGLLIMVEKYLHAMKKHDSDEMDEICNAYVSLHEYINNWDLVDLSAIKIVGNHEVRIKVEQQATEDFILHHSDLAPTLMDEWIKPGHTLWQQRIAMVSTWMHIRRGMPQAAFRRASYMLESPHDLLHKAAGWMLREAWKQGYQAELREFLTTNVSRMPAVMLSYATEQMPPPERHHWQTLRKTRFDTCSIKPEMSHTVCRGVDRGATFR